MRPFRGRSVVRATTISLNRLRARQGILYRSMKFTAVFQPSPQRTRYAPVLYPVESLTAGHHGKVHGDLATAANVELASACVMNSVLRGKTFPGLPAPLPPPRQPSLGSGGATDASAGEQKGSVGDKRDGAGGAGTGKSVCVFEVALSVALRQHEEFPYPVSNVWAAGVMLLLHEWMVNRGEHRAAEG